MCSVAVKATVDRAGVVGEAIERIYMGCVLPATLGQDPARQAALAAGLPYSVQATTVNKMCGSGMQAAIMACEALQSGAIDLAIAGGMESMTNAPYAMAKHRGGARLGHDRIIDTMMMDGLEQRGFIAARDIEHAMMSGREPAWSIGTYMSE